jgi:hypothetical protein
MWRPGRALTVGFIPNPSKERPQMKIVIAALAAAAVLAVAAPAGARPVDAYGPIPSDAPTTVTTPASSPSSGTETWIVIAAAALSFAAGAGAARVAPAVLPRSEHGPATAR